MKKLKGILSIFIVMIMALSVQVPAFAAEQTIAPKVTFSNFTVDKTTIKPGDIFTFTVTASSTRGQYIDDASFKFSGGDAFSVYKGSDTEYVSAFSSSVTVSKTFICNNETTAGSHPISVSCSFWGGKRFFYDIEWNKIDDGTGGDKEEQIMLGLRLAKGIDKSLVDRDFAEFVKMGYVADLGERIALTPKGMLVSNTIINYIIG